MLETMTVQEYIEMYETTGKTVEIQDGKILGIQSSDGPGISAERD